MYNMERYCTSLYCIENRIGQDAAGGKKIHIGADIWPKKNTVGKSLRVF